MKFFVIFYLILAIYQVSSAESSVNYRIIEKIHDSGDVNDFSIRSIRLDGQHVVVEVSSKERGHEFQFHRFQISHQDVKAIKQSVGNIQQNSDLANDLFFLDSLDGSRQVALVLADSGL